MTEILMMIGGLFILGHIIAYSIITGVVLWLCWQVWPILFKLFFIGFSALFVVSTGTVLLLI